SIATDCMDASEKCSVVPIQSRGQQNLDLGPQESLPPQPRLTVDKVSGFPSSMFRSRFLRNRGLAYASGWHLPPFFLLRAGGRGARSAWARVRSAALIVFAATLISAA